MSKQTTHKRLSQMKHITVNHTEEKEGQLIYKRSLSESFFKT